MNSVNKTLYIPLFGKAYVSKRGLFINDEMAERIWNAAGFELKGKSASKWLALYMGIRSAVFDEWTKTQTTCAQDAIIIHIGCGLDSRVCRIDLPNREWYDVDFSEVIRERKLYYHESIDYRMISGDVRENEWLTEIPEARCAIVIMEGVSMYMKPEELRTLFANLRSHFENISILMDSYSSFAARISKYKNPINDVGVTEVYGIDDPTLLQVDDLTFVKEHIMTPQKYVNALNGIEKHIFKKIYAGRFSKKLYRLFEYSNA